MIIVSMNKKHIEVVLRYLKANKSKVKFHQLPLLRDRISNTPQEDRIELNLDIKEEFYVFWNIMDCIMRYKAFMRWHSVTLNKEIYSESVDDLFYEVAKELELFIRWKNNISADAASKEILVKEMNTQSIIECLLFTQMYDSRLEIKSNAKKGYGPFARPFLPAESRNTLDFFPN